VNPLRVTATNYRSFERLDLDLPTGTCAVTGANGAGKSSVVNLVDLAIFGAESRTLADYLREDADEMEIVLEFEHAGEDYRVRRGFSARGRGRSTLDFERWEEEA